jgi:hypothetical protein
MRDFTQDILELIRPTSTDLPPGLEDRLKSYGKEISNLLMDVVAE